MMTHLYAIMNTNYEIHLPSLIFYKHTQLIYVCWTDTYIIFLFSDISSSRVLEFCTNF